MQTKPKRKPGIERTLRKGVGHSVVPGSCPKVKGRLPVHVLTRWLSMYGWYLFASQKPESVELASAAEVDQTLENTRDARSDLTAHSVVATQPKSQKRRGSVKA